MSKFKLKIGDGSTAWSNLPYVVGSDVAEYNVVTLSDSSTTRTININSTTVTQNTVYKFSTVFTGGTLVLNVTEQVPFDVVVHFETQVMPLSISTTSTIKTIGDTSIGGNYYGEIRLINDTAVITSSPKSDNYSPDLYYTDEVATIEENYITTTTAFYAAQRQMVYAPTYRSGEYTIHNLTSGWVKYFLPTEWTGPDLNDSWTLNYHYGLMPPKSRMTIHYDTTSLVWTIVSRSWSTIPEIINVTSAISVSSSPTQLIANYFNNKLSGLSISEGVIKDWLRDMASSPIKLYFLNSTNSVFTLTTASGQVYVPVGYCIEIICWNNYTVSADSQGYNLNFYKTVETIQ